MSQIQSKLAPFLMVQIKIMEISAVLKGTKITQISIVLEGNTPEFGEIDGGNLLGLLDLLLVSADLGLHLVNQVAHPLSILPVLIGPSAERLNYHNPAGRIHINELFTPLTSAFKRITLQYLRLFLKFLANLFLYILYNSVNFIQESPVFQLSVAKNRISLTFKKTILRPFMSQKAGGF